MAPQRSRSAAAAAGLAALAALAALQLASRAFAGPAAGGRTPARVARQVNIFEGLPSLPAFGERLDPEETGTRSARVVDESQSRLVEVNMPLGMAFEERDGGDIYISGVDESSDAYSQGVRPGAQLVMVSATFGDEMWNARKVGMTQFMTVVNSRFGSTMRLALEKEDQNVIGSFLEAFKPKEKTKDELRHHGEREMLLKNLLQQAT